MKGWLVSLCIVLLCGCKQEVSHIEHKLDDSTMVLVMTDAFILNAAFSQTFGSVKDSVSRAYIGQLSRKYKVDQNVLEDNIQDLYNDLERLDTFYDLLLTRIDYLEDNINDLKVKPKGINNVPSKPRPSE